MLSRSLQAVFTSGLPVSTKELLFTRLVKESGVSVCTDIYGCRVVEAAWYACGDEVRSILRGVVSDYQDQVMATKWGRIMYAKLRLGRHAPGSSVASKKRAIMEIFS